MMTSWKSSGTDNWCVTCSSRFCWLKWVWSSNRSSTQEVWVPRKLDETQQWPGWKLSKKTSTESLSAFCSDSVTLCESFSHIRSSGCFSSGPVGNTLQWLVLWHFSLLFSFSLNNCPQVCRLFRKLLLRPKDPQKSQRERHADMIYLSGAILIRLAAIFSADDVCCQRWDLITRDTNLGLITLPFVDVHINSNPVMCSFPHIYCICCFINQSPTYDKAPALESSSISN